jgi:hypothetical protein
MLFGMRPCLFRGYNMVKFIEAVKIKKSGCQKCFSVLYFLPCALNKNIVDYLVNFGKPIYRLNATKLLRIDTNDSLHIEGKIGGKKIKLVMPKSFSNVDWEKIDRKNEFEKRLADWITDTLQINVER